MTLISLLCCNHLRLEHMSYAPFQPAGARHTVVVLFVALVDDVRLTIFARAVNDRRI